MRISETHTLSQIDQLYLLSRIRTEGAITDAEFTILKRKVMSHPGGHPDLRKFTVRRGGEASSWAYPRTIYDTTERTNPEDGVSFQDAVRGCLRNYAAFSGRAPRSEFWFWVLFVFLGSFAATVIDAVLGMAEIASDLYVPGPLYVLFTLAAFVPSLAVAVRRLHDTDRSGWWYALIFVPVIGIVVLTVWFAIKGTHGDNDYGPDPLLPEESLIPEPLRLISMRPLGM